MLQVYLGALAFGGTLLIASLLLGHGQKDLDGADEGGGKDSDTKDTGGDSFAWLPVASLRFWTFLLAFGGAAGALLTWAGSLPVPGVAGIAGGVGWISGVAMVGAMRTLRRGSAGSELALAELHGESAQVLIAIPMGGVGKVRLNAKGRVVDLIAETEDTLPLPAGSTVMILGEGAEGRVQVTRSES